MKTFRNPPDVHQPAGIYSHQVEIRGPERLLAVAGQIGMREDGSVPDDALEQLDVALDNVERNLRAAGMGLADVIKVTYFHVGQVDAARRRELLLARFKDHRPVSTLLYVSALAAPPYKVEVEVWAARAESGPG